MLHHTLAGLRVLDLTHVVAGPVCAMTLADLGADVIKVEPLTGEIGRDIGPVAPHGESVINLSVNRNKRSVAIDLKSTSGKELIRTLIRGSDVLVESYRPGVARRLGISHEQTLELNPRLVYCSISAFGQSGPWIDRPGVDGLAQAMSGLMSTIGTDGTPPAKVPTPVSDMVTGYLAAVTILAAVHDVGQSGRGHYIDVSLFNASVMLQQTQFASYFASGQSPSRTGSAAPYACPNEAYATRDGWLMVAAYRQPAWRAFCKVIGRPDLVSDPRFLTNADRVVHRRDLADQVEQALVTGTSEEWVKLLAEVDVMCGPVLDYDAVVDSDLFEASGLDSTMAHPVAGEVRLPAFAPGPSHRTSAPPRPAPQVGEHTDEVLAELGLSAAQVRRLRADGAVA